MTVHLTTDDLLVLTEAITGDRLVRDVGLLDAAAYRTQASAFGQDAYPDLAAKAAALLHSIVRGHPLVDGNKRLCWAAALLFYDMNDQALELPADPNVSAAFVLRVADGSMGDDVEKIAAVFRGWEVTTPDGR